MHAQVPWVMGLRNPDQDRPLSDKCWNLFEPEIDLRSSEIIKEVAELRKTGKITQPIYLQPRLEMTG